MLALKKTRFDEAEEDFRALVVLKPDDEWAKGRLARTLTLRSQRSLGARRFQAAIADANTALELAPEDTNIQLTLADVHLAMGKQELAAEEYQRVLDVKPRDLHARMGLQRANAPKGSKAAAAPMVPAPVKKKPPANTPQKTVPSAAKPAATTANKPAAAATVKKTR
jgi:tetratricopeptide (TPR) repeat protein